MMTMDYDSALEFIARIRALVDGGLTCKEVARKLGVTPEVIDGLAHRNQIKFRRENPELTQRMRELAAIGYSQTAASIHLNITLAKVRWTAGKYGIVFRPERQKRSFREAA